MAFLLAGALWSLAALLAGLVSGTPFLRTFGAAGFVLFVGGAVVLDHFTQAPVEEDPVLWGDVELEPWPDREDGRRAA